MKDIEGNILTFPNSNRPATRYMYFHYLVAILTNENTRNMNIDELRAQGWLWQPSRPWFRYSFILEVVKCFTEKEQLLGLFEQATFCDESGRCKEDEEDMATEMCIALREEVNHCGDSDYDSDENDRRDW
jgi:hypothetical protein